MEPLLPAQQPKIPSTDVHREIGDCLRASCRTEMENARPGEGATLSRVLDDFSGKVLRGIEQNTAVDPRSTIAGARPDPNAPPRPRRPRTPLRLTPFAAILCRAAG